MSDNSQKLMHVFLRWQVFTSIVLWHQMQP